MKGIKLKGQRFKIKIIDARDSYTAGYLFFYFFRDTSVFVMDKFKFIQNIFGIRHYEKGMSYSYVFSAIFFGNLLSTIGFLLLDF